MAKCSECNKEMLKADGCRNSAIRLLATYARILFTNETRFGDDFKDENGDRRCHDCGCKPGNFHHSGCDMEECPQCHGQLISCDCKEV